MRTVPVLDRITRQLAERRSSGLFRATAGYRGTTGILDLSTNSYLGLHENSEIAAEAAQLLDGYPGGNLASRLVSESSPLCRVLEEEIARWDTAEDALIFNSGYAANIGIIQSLCTRSTEVFSDRLNHASIYDGIRLAGCGLIRYRHCDMNDLETRLKTSAAPEKIIITDTVFSMDGDRAPLRDIASLGEKHRALVIVDEAHATGLFGERGSGLVEETGTEKAIHVRMGTLSKAIGGLGGYAAVSAQLRDYFVNFARSLIYSTGLPPPVLAYDLAAVKYLKRHSAYGRELQSGAQRFRSKLTAAGFSTDPSSTQIIPCYTEDAVEAVALSRYLRERGVIAPAIRPPTVPDGTARIRFSWSHLFTDQDADTVTGHCSDWRRNRG